MHTGSSTCPCHTDQDPGVHKQVHQRGQGLYIDLHSIGVRCPSAGSTSGNMARGGKWRGACLPAPRRQVTMVTNVV